MEIYTSLNDYGFEVSVYSCLFIENVRYRLRDKTNNKLIAEIDNDLNIINSVKDIVYSKSVETVVKILKWHEA